MERIAPRDLPIQALESIYMGVEIRKTEYDRERFLDTEDPSERPFAMKLLDWFLRDGFKTELSDCSLTGVIAFGGTSP